MIHMKQEGDNDQLLKAFLGYYRPHVALFVADTVCALVLAGADLAFPQILRSLTSGLFTMKPDIIRAAIPAVAFGLVVLYVVRYFCRWFVTS